MAVSLNGASRSVTWTLIWLHDAAGELLAAPTDPARVVEIASRMRAAARSLALLLEVAIDD